MKTIGVGQLKAEFSSILKRVEKYGEEFIIKYGKKNKKIAKIVPYKEEKKERKFGQLKGKIWISDDFNEENEYINKLFYNGEINP